MKPTFLFFPLLCACLVPTTMLQSQQSWTAAQRFSTSNNDLLTNAAVTLGADGSTYVVGSFRNSVSFDTLVLNAPIVNKTQGFLLKLDPQLKPVWASQFPQKPFDVTIDAQENLFVAGSFRKAANDDSDSLAFVAKYNSDGVPLATFSAAGSAESWAKVVRTDAAGNCFIAGERFSAGNTIFGAIPMPTVSSRECFLVKLTPDLSQVLWAKYTGSSSNLDNVYDIEIDNANGFVYATGNYSQNYSIPIFGCGCYNGDFYVEKHNVSTGVSVWKKIFSGGSGDDTKQFLRLAPDGQTLAVAACFKKTTLFEPTISLTANPGNQYDYHIYLAELNTSNATVQWAKKMSTSGDSFLWRMARDADDVWLHGYFTKPTDIGAISLTSTNTDAFFAKITASNGSVLEAEKLAGNSTEFGFGLAVRDSMIVVSGASASTVSNLSIGTFSLPGTANSIYVARKGGMLQLAPLASFEASVTSGCAPLAVQFTNTALQNPSSFFWQFPGGVPATSMDPNPSVSYDLPGDYPVTLRVTNAGGADTLVQTNLIHVLGSTPTASFTSSVNGLIASFTNTSANASTYSWDFGDGQTSNQPNPVHSYADCNTYTVTLVATNICGIASSTASVTTMSPPTAMFSTTVNEFVVSFLNTSTGGASYFWNFGDSSTSDLENPPPHVYADSGIYVVTLVVTNNCGATIFQQEVRIETTVGTDTPRWLKGFRLFPNPSSGVFTLEMTADWPGEIELTCMNSTGQLLITETISPSSASVQRQIDLGAVPDGVYWLRVHSGSQSRMQKMLVTR